MWVALRHKHFADATNEITRTMDEFRQKNKAAAYKQGAGGDGALDLRNMKNLVSSLPQYRYGRTAVKTTKAPAVAAPVMSSAYHCVVIQPQWHNLSTPEVHNAC